MANNKVVFGNQTIIDMTDATATADDLDMGAKAYDRNGNLITGTAQNVKWHEAKDYVAKNLYRLPDNDLTAGNTTLHVNADKSITISGQGSSSDRFDVFTGVPIAAGRYMFSVEGISSSQYTMFSIFLVDQFVNYTIDSDMPMPIAVDSDTTMDATIALKTGAYNITLRPMLKFTSSPSGFEGYFKSNVELENELKELSNVARTGNYNDLSNKPTIPAAVSVKGNAESSYRTGQVNLTSANIGAVNKSGDEMTGMLGVNIPSTTTAAQASYLFLGNATPSGTVGNSRGRIRVYGENDKFCDLGLQTPSDDVTVWLPNASGTLERQWQSLGMITNTQTVTIPQYATDLHVMVYVGGNQKTRHHITIPYPRSSAAQGTHITGFAYSDKYSGTISVRIDANGVFSLYDGWTRVNYDGTTIGISNMDAYVYVR